MIHATPTRSHPPSDSPKVEKTIGLWGLTPRDLYAAYWAARGVQCVRVGEQQPLDRTVDLFFLLEPNQFAFFDLASLIDRITWRGARVTRVRLVEACDDTVYSEQIRLDERGCVARIDRVYKPIEHAVHRILITRRPQLARLWMHASNSRDGWRNIRRRLPPTLLDRVRTRGHCFAADDPTQEQNMLTHLVTNWRDPNRSIDGIEQIAPGVWTLTDEVRTKATLIGPLWLGCGRMPGDEDCLVGPDWREDHAGANAKHTMAAEVLRLRSIELPDVGRRMKRSNERSWYQAAKRSFDIAVSATLLVMLVPVIIVIAAAIVIDNGFPVLFAHRRESKNGRPFDCLKFRTMRKDAEAMVASLEEQNQCDGPQVNIENDPRVTRIGHVLRRTHLDELPQLWNVLKGEMSLVGPRPSPRHENQCCPAWRETRLSVRPGITGLWQLKRTRAPGQDFQEWIKYDIEYVRRANIWLDLMICIRTAYVIVFGRDSDEAV